MKESAGIWRSFPGAFMHSHFSIPPGHALLTNASAVSVINEMSVTSSKKWVGSWLAPGSFVTGADRIWNYGIHPDCRDASFHTLPSTFFSSAPVRAIKHGIKIQRAIITLSFSNLRQSNVQPHAHQEWRDVAAAKLLLARVCHPLGPWSKGRKVVESRMTFWDSLCSKKSDDSA